MMLAILGLAVAGCLLGLLTPPGEGIHGGKGEQLLDLLRVLTTVALAISLLLGPGVAWRRLRGPRAPSLAFLFIPGLLVMFAVGTVAWALSGEIDPRATCLMLTAPVLGLVLATVLGGGPEDIFSGEEQRALVVVGCVLGLAVARALWSLGPEGELYSGTISRTLEVGDRPDSRISFILPQLVAHHEGPFGPLGTAMFFPYNFSSRGPIAGLASTPVVLLGGGHPPAAFAEEAWAPFDHQGFEAYRLAMMTFACTAFLALWDLTRRLAGLAAARFAVLLAATTPFLVHEVWFTWPKLLAAAMILTAALCVVDRRFFLAGLFAGLGYLCHPAALLSLPMLGLLALWPLRGALWKRPRLTAALSLGAGVAVFLVVWRIFSGSHYDQNQFFDYLTSAGFDLHPGLGTWFEYRLHSLADSVVPLLLPLGSPHNYSINVVGGMSPGVIHFFFQYWDTVPFGMAIVFLPMLLVGLWRALRHWPWAVVATVLIPFALFTIYWGASTSGMMREGLQAWALTLIVVLACEQARTGFGWLRSTTARVVLVLRVVEVAAVAVVPTLATRQMLVAAHFQVTDTLALVAMAGFSLALGTMVWTQPREPLRS
jgi:hypothetical protein